MSEPKFQNNQENLRLSYSELCNSYHAVDDFRAKLLGLMPLVSGFAIFELLGKPAVASYLSVIGVLGVAVSLGLFIYELKGIQKCTRYIHYGGQIEKKLLAMEFTGHFNSLSLDEKQKWTYLFTEPVASAIIYASVIGAWLYVAMIKVNCNNVGNIENNLLWPIIVASVVFAGGIIYWLYCMRSLNKKLLKT